MTTPFALLVAFLVGALVGHLLSEKAERARPAITPFDDPDRHD